MHAKTANEVSGPMFLESKNMLQESRAVARKPRDAAAVLFRLKFADDIHYKFKSNQASKARLQNSGVVDKLAACMREGQRSSL